MCVESVFPFGRPLNLFMLVGSSSVAWRCSNLQQIATVPSSLMRFRQVRPEGSALWVSQARCWQAGRLTQNMNIGSTRPVYESVAGIFKRTVDSLSAGGPYSQKNCREAGQTKPIPEPTSVPQLNNPEFPALNNSDLILTRDKADTQGRCSKSRRLLQRQIL